MRFGTTSDSLDSSWALGKTTRTRYSATGVPAPRLPAARRVQATPTAPNFKVTSEVSPVALTESRRCRVEYPPESSPEKPGSGRRSTLNSEEAQKTHAEKR